MPGIELMSIDEVLLDAGALCAVAASGKASSSAASKTERCGAVEVFRRCMVMTPPPRGTCPLPCDTTGGRSEEHTSELQSLMRISYAVFCFKKKNNNKHTTR